MTNGDKIRAMNDEELAEYMAPYESGCPRWAEHDISCMKHSTCYRCWLDWLRETAVMIDHGYSGGSMTVRKAADAIEELSKKNTDSEVDNINLTGWLAEEHAKHRWIRAEDELPEEWNKVLTFQPTTSDDCGLIRGAVYIGDGKWRETESHSLLELPVTHWMPLPEPPEEESPIITKASPASLGIYEKEET